ncbi:MAG: hypothetical protein ACYTG0_38085 [Planctomycetota bacterium]|jgi:hypothetical protein
MSEASIKPECGETTRGEPGRQQDPAGGTAAEMSACCGPDMTEMMQECPCASAMKGHWKTDLVAFSLVFLAFLISQVGGILGMIALFRTF